MERRTARERAGYSRCGEDRPGGPDAGGGSYLEAVAADCIAVVGRGELVAVATGRRIVVVSFDEVEDSTAAPEPLLEMDMPADVLSLAAGGTRHPADLLVVLDDGSACRVDLAGLPTGDRLEPQTLVSGLDGLTKLVPIQSRLIALRRLQGRGWQLLDIDRRSGRADVLVDLPFASVRTIAPLHSSKSTIVIVTDSSGEAHAVDTARSGDRSIAGLAAADRVTAAVLGDDGYLYLGRKGGSIAKVAAGELSTGRSDHLEVVRRLCKLLNTLLVACGCEPCRPTEPPEPTDRSQPVGGGLVDDEPCGERHVAQLGFTPHRLIPAGAHLIALSSANRRMAVLDSRLDVVFERYTGTRGAAVATADKPSDRAVIVPTTGAVLEAWAVDTYARELAGPPLATGLGPSVASAADEPVTYYGLSAPGTTPNPHLRVCVFNVTEPGQAYGHVDQGPMQAHLVPRVYDIVHDYYDENSFGELEVEFSVFGADFGGTRGPLVLPVAAATYFWEDFTSGGVEATMPADWADPLVLDGTESMTIESEPIVGVGRTYAVPFAALWTRQAHANYPVTIDLLGTETFTLDVIDQTGTAHALVVTPGALSITHDQGDDEAAFLGQIGAHVTAAIRTAEAVLPGSPTLIQDIAFRRIRTNDDDTEFGILQGQVRVAPPDDPTAATQKGGVTLTTAIPTPPGLQSIGLDPTAAAGSDPVSGVLDTEVRTLGYLGQCLTAAQVDEGEGPGATDPHFNPSPVARGAPDPLEVTVRINLTNESGGGGAYLDVTGSSGLGPSGWAAASRVVGSTVSANRQNTLRFHQLLADDVFTAALEHLRSIGPWNRDAAQAMFDDFDVMMIGFVGAAPAGEWAAQNPVDFDRLRMFRRTHFATDQKNPNPAADPVTFGSSAIVGQKFDGFLPGLMSHELGHSLGLPDLYSATGFRDDVRYVNAWALMAGGNYENLNHFCGWSKWARGWIVDDPTDPDANRVIEVPLPQPQDTPPVDAWLVPVEYWDEMIKSDVRDAVGGDVPIGQLMKVDLGSDGGVVDLIELRAQGTTYSASLPAMPEVLCTNVLAPGTDRRWAVNGLYRRSVHQLNRDGELTAVSDVFDFATSAEFPLVGCKAEIVAVDSIRGGTVPIARVRVEREDADYIDLHFQDNVPSWRSPDIWVDWRGDNPDPDEARIYPVGTPTDQGEVVRFPAAGAVEPHFLVARVHNGGTADAEDVEVRWFKCDPPGAGDDGRWVTQDTRAIPGIAGGGWEIVPFDWDVDQNTKSHQCIRAEIIDWSLPVTVDPATGDTVALGSDDVALQNNNAQQNVFDFEALVSSPYDPIEFEFQVHNDAKVSEIAYLVPSRLPAGIRLTIDPAQASVAPDSAAVFRCTLELDEHRIRPGCNNDRGFLLTAWRAADDADEPWGSCFYFVRPRLRTAIEAERAAFRKERITVHGILRLLADKQQSLQQHLPLVVRVRAVPLNGGKHRPMWATAPVQANGSFAAEFVYPDVAPNAVEVQAWFDRTDELGSSTSSPRQFTQTVIR